MSQIPEFPKERHEAEKLYRVAASIANETGQPVQMPGDALGRPNENVYMAPGNERGTLVDSRQKMMELAKEGIDFTDHIVLNDEVWKQFHEKKESDSAKVTNPTIEAEAPSDSISTEKEETKSLDDVVNSPVEQSEDKVTDTQKIRNASIMSKYSGKKIEVPQKDGNVIIKYVESEGRAVSTPASKFEDAIPYEQAIEDPTINPLYKDLEDIAIRFSAHDRPAIVRRTEYVASFIPIVHQIISGVGKIFDTKEKITRKPTTEKEKKLIDARGGVVYTHEETKQLKESASKIREVIRLLQTDGNNCDEGEDLSWSQRFFAVPYRNGKPVINVDEVMKPSIGNDWKSNSKIHKSDVHMAKRRIWLPTFKNKSFNKMQVMEADVFVEKLKDPAFIDGLKIGNTYSKDNRVRYVLNPVAVTGAIGAGSYYIGAPLAAKVLDEFFPDVPQQVQDLYYSALHFFGGTKASNLENTAQNLANQREQDLTTEVIIFPELGKEYQEIEAMLKQLGEDHNTIDYRLEEVFTNVHSSASGLSVALTDGANNFIFEPTAQFLGLQNEYATLREFIGQGLTEVAIRGQQHIIDQRYGEGTTDTLIENIREHGSIRQGAAATELEMREIQDDARREHLEEILEQESEGLRGDMADMLDYLGSIRTTYRGQGSAADLAQELGQVVESSGEEYVRTRDPAALERINEYLESEDWQSKLEEVREQNTQEGQMIANFYEKVEDFFAIATDAKSQIEDIQEAYNELGTLRDQYRAVGTDEEHISTTPQIEQLDNLLEQSYAKVEAAYEHVNTSDSAASVAYREQFGEAHMRKATWGDVTGMIAAGLAATLLVVGTYQSVKRLFKGRPKN